MQNAWSFQGYMDYCLGWSHMVGHKTNLSKLKYGNQAIFSATVELI